jgi:hypothetical protein
MLNKKATDNFVSTKFLKLGNENESGGKKVLSLAIVIGHNIL